jgi:flagellar protein FlgJ
MNVGLIQNTYSGITNGKGALQSAKTNSDNAKFSELIERLQKQNDGRGTLSSSQIAQDGRLNGDYSSSFAGTFSSEKDKNALPVGAAANQANSNVKTKTIDKTSVLYEKSLELENFFVKQMLSEMRKTVLKSQESDFAQQTYEDMLFDEYATAMTKNAGFGLADQIYLSLV